jgi:hypothetical protein
MQQPRSRIPVRALPASELSDALVAQQYHVQALMDLAAAAAVAPDAAAASAAPATGDTSIFAPLANGLEAVLKQIQGVLNRAHVPYSYGYSIILLTVLVKILTFPLTKKQVRARVRPRQGGPGKAPSQAAACSRLARGPNSRGAARQRGLGKALSQGAACSRLARGPN